MAIMGIRGQALENEIFFVTSRSGGPGGQHVNKVETRVELCFRVDESVVLNPSRKKKIHRALASRITRDGVLKVAAASSRSQARNKEIALERFYKLLEQALKPVKKRIPTKPSKASRAKRLLDKKMLGEKKEMRKKI